jgi:hypothetical protein
LTIDIPPKAETTTESVPVSFGGAVTVSLVGLVTDVTVAVVPPNVTEVTVVKFVPLTTTFVAVVALPTGGVTDVTDGMPTVGPEDNVRVMVSVYVPGAALAGMFNHQSVARSLAPIPVDLPAVATMLGGDVPLRVVPVNVTG